MSENKKHSGDSGGADVVSSPFSKVFFWVLLIVYAAFTWHTMLRHEPWRDEAYAWLMARDAGLVEFFKLRAYDWSPALWYMMLMPFAKLGFPYLTMSILHWCLALASVALFLKKSLFNWWTKVLFVFSYFMFWEYVISVRVYTVGIFMLFCMASIYSKRFVVPYIYLYAAMLAALFNSNMHLLGMAGGLLLSYLFEVWRGNKFNTHVIAAIAIMLLGAGLLFLQVGFVPTDHVDAGQIVGKLDVGNLINGITVPFFTGSNAGYLFWPAGLAVLTIVGASLLVRPPLFLIYFSNAVFLMFVFATKGGGVRHNGLLLIGVIFCLWLGLARSKGDLVWFFFDNKYKKITFVATVMLTLCLLMSMPFGFMLHRMESRYNYSGGKVVALFISENGLNDIPIAAHRDAQAASVLPYLPGKKLWYPIIEGFGTFIIQNRQRLDAYYKVTYQEALQRIGRNFPSGPLLVLLDAPLERADLHGYRLLFKVDDTVFGSDERFYLYERVPRKSVL